MSSRLDRLRARTAALGARAALVSRLPDIRWAVGFSGSNALLVVTPDAAHLITDGRYREQARTECPDATVHIAPSTLAAALPEVCPLDGPVALQTDVVTVDGWDALAEALPGAVFVPAPGLLSEIIAAKDEQEHDALRRAQALTCAVMESVVADLRPGLTELDVAAEIVYRHLRCGALAMSFEPIVASGPNAALPHARPTTRRLAAGDLVVLDMGGVLDGYCADLTRTVAIGPPSDEARRVYDTVGRAQQAALDAARAGVSGAVLDRAARSVIEAAGYGEAFSHSLGHGVGLEVHEWPRLSQQVEHVLPAGAAVTIEPGIYLPGRLGVRTEDLIVVTADGHENLTPLAHDLVVV